MVLLGKEMKTLFEFTYENKRTFSPQARLQMAFLENRIRFSFKQDMSLFWTEAGNRMVLEDALNGQDVLRQDEQELLVATLINLLTIHAHLTYVSKQLLDMMKQRIHFDWMTSEDRTKHMRVVAEK